MLCQIPLQSRTWPNRLSSGEAEDYKFTIVDVFSLPWSMLLQLLNSALNSIDVLANDFRADRDVLSSGHFWHHCRWLGDTVGGTVHTPAAGFIGVDSFSYMENPLARGFRVGRGRRQSILRASSCRLCQLRSQPMR